MSQASPDRLDRIEAILEQVARQQATNTTAIAQLTVKVDGLTEDVASVTDILMHSIAQLTVKIDGLTEDVASVTDILMHSIQIAEADREVFQAEIRRIWEYLLGQQRNGKGRGEG
ncbi:MAG: hypothetical protein ACFKPT_11020 [Gloeotrichia echinulata GP01]